MSTGRVLQAFKVQRAGRLQQMRQPTSPRPKGSKGVQKPGARGSQRPGQKSGMGSIHALFQRSQSQQRP